MSQTAHRVTAPSRRAAARLCAGVIGALVLAGCSQVSTDTAEAGRLVKEYASSNDVAGDRMPTADTSGDRLANLASMGPPEAIIGALMQPVACDGPEGAIYRVKSPCDPADEVLKAREEAAGADAPMYGRSILVKHDDGGLELLTLYLVPKPDKSVALIDGQGAVHAGLEDFLDDTDVLSSGDRALMPQMITSTKLQGKAVVVTVGGITWWQWLLIACVLALAAVAVVAFTRRRAKARADAGAWPA